MILYGCLLIFFEVFFVVVFRGILNNNNMVVFREIYFEFYELRLLVLLVKMIVLIVIVIVFIRKIIIEVLMMENVYVVYENFGKMNIVYFVYYMEKDKFVEDYF